MGSVLRNLGVSTADATNVRFAYDGARVTVRFRDWNEIEREITFDDVLALRWVAAGEARSFRDDMTCEVESSDWLRKTATEHGVPTETHAHYQLGFNAPGMVLEILARRIESPP